MMVNDFSNEVVLLRFIMDMFKDQHQSDVMMVDDDLLLTNLSSSTVSSSSQPDAETTDQEQLLLLMPIWAYQSAAVYLIFISVFGLLMNIVVVIVIISDPQKMTPLNWMLLNLACSDGTIAGFGTTISTAAALKFGWPFGDELCVAYAMIMSTAGIGSITTLTALALWRCQLVVYCPAKRSGAFANHHSSGGSGGSSGKLGRVQATILLTLIWTYSLAVTCPPLFGWGRYDREAAHISCSVNWESKMDNNRSYILYMFTFGLFVPLVVIVVSYLSILRVVKKTGRFKRATLLQTSTQQQQPNEQRMTPDIQQHQEVMQQNFNNNQLQQPARNPKSNSEAAIERDKKPKKQSDAAEKRVTVMVACMVGAFMAAWTPYSILALFETFIGDAGHQSTRNISSSFTTGGHQTRHEANRQMDDEKSDAEENFFNYVGTISPAFATIPSLFAKTSAVLNPLIYGLLNTQFRSAWDKFLTRFFGRRRRYYHTSQEQGYSGNQMERHKLRRLLDFSFTLKPSVTVNLPMREIVPLINNDSQNSTANQQKCTSFKTLKGVVSASSPVTSSQTAPQHPPTGDSNYKKSDVSSARLYSETGNPLVGGASSSSGLDNSKFPNKSSSKNCHRNLVVNTRQQQEQPVKLVVVRLLSDSTSCCYTTDETDISLSPAIGRSLSTKSQANKANSLPRQL